MQKKQRHKFEHLKSIMQWRKPKNDSLSIDDKAFMESLILVLQRLWEPIIYTALIAAFGFVYGLYIIFYAGTILGETIIEIWDPKYVNSKPSQVFNVKQALSTSPLPTNRNSAQVLVLSN